MGISVYLGARRRARGCPPWWFIGRESRREIVPVTSEPADEGRRGRAGPWQHGSPGTRSGRFLLTPAGET